MERSSIHLSLTVFLKLDPEVKDAAKKRIKVICRLWNLLLSSIKQGSPKCRSLRAQEQRRPDFLQFFERVSAKFSYSINVRQQYRNKCSNRLQKNHCCLPKTSWWQQFSIKDHKSSTWFKKVCRYLSRHLLCQMLVWRDLHLYIVFNLVVSLGIGKKCIFVLSLSVN